MTEPLTIRLLGQVRVGAGGAAAGGSVPGGRRNTLVLARLVVDAGHPVSNAELAATIWPRERPAAWKASLRNVVAEVRSWLHRLGLAMRIESSVAGYQLDLDDDARVDLDILLSAPTRAEAVLAQGRDGDALALVDEALTYLRPGFLVGIDVPWVIEMRRRLDAATSTLFVVGATAALHLGDITRAEVLAVRSIEQDEVREDGHRLLMRALSAAGNRGAALAAYHRCRDILITRLGSEPAPATRELFQELLADDEPAEIATKTRPALALQAAAPFVGRRAELHRVDVLFGQTPRTGPLVVHVEGESGIGKTRFAAEVADRMFGRGIPTLYGRADDRVDVPHQPLLEAIDSYVRQLDRPGRGDLLGPHSPQLAHFVGAVRDVVAAEPPSGLPELDRRHLITAIGEVLAAVAGPVGAVLILDDMHWGSRATLELLGRLGEIIPRSALLVLVLQRAGAATDAAVGEPARSVIALAGLGVAEVEAMMAGPAAAKPSNELARAIWADTGGNPLFVAELLRSGEDLVVNGAGGPRPARSQRLHQLVRARVATLARGSRTWLEIAAVAGLEFEPELVRIAGGLSSATAAEALEAASAEGLVNAASSPTRRAFRHALVRQCLLDDLEDDRSYLMTIHARVGAALEAQRSSSTPRLAHHTSAAAPLGDWQRAVKYGLAAARSAAQALVHDDVITIARRTLVILADAGDPDGEARIRLTVLLGTSQRELYDPAGEATLQAAFEQALEQGFPRLAAEAALGFTSAGAAGDELAVDTRRAAIYERALAGLGDGSDGLRAQLLGRLSTASSWLRDGASGRRYAEQALELARNVGDVATVASVLISTRRGLSGIGEPALERAIEDELLDISESLDDPGMAAGAWLWRFESAIEQGHGAELERCLDQAAQGMAGLGVPSYRYTLAYSEAARLLLRGDLDAADAAVERAFRLGVDLGVDALVTGGIRMIQLMGVRHEQGRLVELRDELADYFGHAGVPEWEGAVAFADAELGRLDTVDGYLQKVFAGYELSGFRTGVGVGFAAHMAGPVAAIDDRQRARILYDMLLPFRGLGTFTSYFTGPVDHALGVLARTLGRERDAQQHLEDALAFCTRLGAPRWITRCTMLRAH